MELHATGCAGVPAGWRRRRPEKRADREVGVPLADSSIRAC